jgi:hypothetical protein
MRLAPEREAQYALDFGLSRSGLSMAAQLAYDHLVAEGKGAPPPPPLTKEERKRARQERHEEFRRRLELAGEITWLPNLGVAVRDGTVYQHGVDRGDSGFDAVASRERRNPEGLKRLGSLAGAHAEVVSGKTGKARRGGGERTGDVIALAPVLGPLALIAALSRSEPGLAVVIFADGSVREKRFTDKPSVTRAQAEAVQFNALAAAADPAEASGSSGHGVVSELERLAALRSSGVLDDEEFRAAKARIITGG